MLLITCLCTHLGLRLPDGRVPHVLAALVSANGEAVIGARIVLELRRQQRSTMEQQEVDAGFWLKGFNPKSQHRVEDSS